MFFLICFLLFVIVFHNISITVFFFYFKSNMLNCIYTENNCRFPIVITTVINATVTLKETVAGDCGAITVIATTYLQFGCL